MTPRTNASPAGAKPPTSTSPPELAADAAETLPRRPTDVPPPPPSREPVPAAGRTRFVEVRVAAARNLPRMDAFGTCDAFCRLSLCEETRETAVRERDGGREVAKETFRVRSLLTV